MRTKALVLSAAISAVSLVSALAADPVYSVNVVGYVTMNLNAGFNLVANPLIGTNNPNTTVTQLIPSAPAGTFVYKYAGGAYEITQFDDLEMAWDRPGMTLPVGQGFFVNVPVGSTLPVTFVGEVAQREASNKQLVSGYNMTGSMVPQAGGIAGVLAVPGSPGSYVYKFVGGPTGYATAGWDDFAEPQNWDNDLQIGVGEGFWVQLTAPAAWNRNFVVQ